MSALTLDFTYVRFYNVGFALQNFSKANVISIVSRTRDALLKTQFFKNSIVTIYCEFMYMQGFYKGDICGIF